MQGTQRGIAKSPYPKKRLHLKKTKNKGKINKGDSL